ncbi:MAG: hypothetical protein V3U75_13425 [Methylococcaceae bacterium]
MKTIADFKRKMIKGSKWHTVHQFNGQAAKDLGVRECTLVQSNCFGLATVTPTGLRTSYCDWPKKVEFKPVDAKTIRIEFDGGRLIYNLISEGV